MGNWTDELLIKQIGFIDLDGDTQMDCVAVGGATDRVEFAAAAVHWRPGLGGRTFSTVRTYYEESWEAGSEFVSLDWADLDRDADSDLVCGSYAYDEVLNAILRYDSATGSLVGAGNPFAVFYSERIGLAHLDNDQFWDALAMGADVAGGDKGTVVFRGVEGGFEPVQELGDVAWWGDIGKIVPPVGVDFVSVCPAGDRLPIAVWPNLIFNPTDVSDPRFVGTASSEHCLPSHPGRSGS